MIFLPKSVSSSARSAKKRSEREENFVAPCASLTNLDMLREIADSVMMSCFRANCLSLVDALLRKELLEHEVDDYF